MVCRLFDLTPGAEVFLFYYNTHPSNPGKLGFVGEPFEECAFCGFHYIIQELQATIFQGICGAGRSGIFLPSRGWYKKSADGCSRDEWGIGSPTGRDGAHFEASAAAATKRDDPQRESRRSSRALPNDLRANLVNGRLGNSGPFAGRACVEENEVLSTIPTTKLMVETLELQSRALVASRTEVEELERVTTVIVPRLKRGGDRGPRAIKVSVETAEKPKAEPEEKQAAMKAQKEVKRKLEAQSKEGADREEALKPK
ncbi:hypothetical protein ACSQ67_010045 [Phaseolus vulgaris]